MTNQKTYFAEKASFFIDLSSSNMVLDPALTWKIDVIYVPLKK